MSSEWGAALKEFRDRTDLTQGEFANSVSKLWLNLTESEKEALETIGIEYLDLSSADVSRYENVRRKPRHRSRYISLIFALYKLDAIKTLDEANNWLLCGGQHPLTDDEQTSIFKSVQSTEGEIDKLPDEESPPRSTTVQLAVDEARAVHEQDEIPSVEQNASESTVPQGSINPVFTIVQRPFAWIRKNAVRLFIWSLLSIGLILSLLAGSDIWGSFIDTLRVSEQIGTRSAAPTTMAVEVPPQQKPAELPLSSSPLVIKRIPLQGNSNDLIQTYIPGFEYSDRVTFNNIEFNMVKGEIIRTHCSIFPDDTREKISFNELNIEEPHQIFLLTNAAATDLANANDRVGVVTLKFTDGTQMETELILGHNIREWRVDAANTINQANHLSLSHVYTGISSEDDTAVIDMLAIEVALIDRVKVLSAIEVADTSKSDFGSTNPCLFIYGVSVKYR